MGREDQPSNEFVSDKRQEPQRTMTRFRSWSAFLRPEKSDHLRPWMDFRFACALAYEKCVSEPISYFHRDVHTRFQGLTVWRCLVCMRAKCGTDVPPACRIVFLAKLQFWRKFLRVPINERTIDKVHYSETFSITRTHIIMVEEVVPEARFRRVVTCFFSLQCTQICRASRVQIATTLQTIKR